MSSHRLSEENHEVEEKIACLEGLLQEANARIKRELELGGVREKETSNQMQKCQVKIEQQSKEIAKQEEKI